MIEQCPYIIECLYEFSSSQHNTEMLLYVSAKRLQKVCCASIMLVTVTYRWWSLGGGRWWGPWRWCCGVSGSCWSRRGTAGRSCHTVQSRDGWQLQFEMRNQNTCINSQVAVFLTSQWHVFSHLHMRKMQELYHMYIQYNLNLSPLSYNQNSCMLWKKIGLQKRKDRRTLMENLANWYI